MIPNPFFPGVLLPTIAFGLLYLWPFLEAHFRKDHNAHNLLERPRDVPLRTAIGAAGVAGYIVLFFAASNDVIAGVFEVAPENVTNTFRVLFFVFPLVTFFVVRKVCRDLQRTGERPLQGLPRTRLVRREGRVESEPLDELEPVPGPAGD
jgi:ubiquinol-cytochrome c reductase cytochrome b subunit